MLGEGAAGPRGPVVGDGWGVSGDLGGGCAEHRGRVGWVPVLAAGCKARELGRKDLDRSGTWRPTRPRAP